MIRGGVINLEKTSKSMEIHAMTPILQACHPMKTISMKMMLPELNATTLLLLLFLWETAMKESSLFRLEDQDAPTEPEIPVTMEAMHASMQVEEAKRVLMEHPLPWARQRTNVSTEQCIPEGRLFGAYTTRGEGITQATFRFPLTVAAIICLAATREAVCSDEGFLSAQLNCANDSSCAQG